MTSTKSKLRAGTVASLIALAGLPGMLRGQPADQATSNYGLVGGLPDLVVNTNGCPPGTVFNAHSKKFEPIVQLPSGKVTEPINDWLVEQKRKGFVRLHEELLMAGEIREVVIVRFVDSPCTGRQFEFDSKGKIVQDDMQVWLH